MRHLTKHYPIRGGLLNRPIGQVRAVDGVDFDVHAGQCLGLVGESGSGKSTIARCIMRAIRPTGGSLRFHGRTGTIDLATASRERLRQARREIQMIFQDPYASLNPRMTVAEIVGEPLLCHGVRSRAEREQRVRELLEDVGLDAGHMKRFPHAFSGGQRQRIGIARALALQPRLIIADEPVSALDVSVQAQVLNLLLNLQRERRLSYLFVAHDLGVVRHLSDRVAVMYVGQLVELADVDQLFATPRHPYTEALLAAIPDVSARRLDDAPAAAGEVADPAHPPPGCLYHPRCPHAQQRCRTDRPTWNQIEPGRWVRCHRAAELTLHGMPMPHTASSAMNV